MGAAPSGAGPRPAGRLAHPARGRHQCGAQGEGRDAARRRPARGAREPARQPGRGDDPRQHGGIPGARGRRPAARAHQAARAVDAARRHLERDRPAFGRRRRRRQRPDPAHSDRARHRRAHPPVGGAVDPDRRAPRQRTRHRRAVDSAPGRRPHPGAGAGPAGSVAAEGTARQDRQAHLPSGRPDHADRSGAAGQRAAGFRAAEKHQGREQPALRDREARRRFGRGPHGRPARLRPAQRRADRRRSASTTTVRAASPR